MLGIPDSRVINVSKDGRVDIELTEKQILFVEAVALQVLFGGAAGGGKSFVQVIDAFLWALKYPGCHQLLLRKTYKELERTLIKTVLSEFPREFGRYNGTDHKYYCNNGSVIEFGYCETKGDVYKYMSAEYDCIRPDEASHFDEFMLIYLVSRIRGTNGFPKQMKMTSNPGNISHRFLKQRFIDGHEPLKVYDISKELGTSTPITVQYIPALVTENTFLMKHNPEYISSLEQLPEKEREALLYGNWNINTGMAFPEFNYSIHTCDDFAIPSHWKRFMAVDNGYSDPFYWAWFAVSPDGIVYLYREYTRSASDDKVIYSSQAEAVVNMMTATTLVQTEDGSYEPAETVERPGYIVAGLDAWNKHHRDQSGKMLVDYYNDGGLTGFTKAVTDRKIRKATLHEYLKPIIDEVSNETYSKIQIFRKACPIAISTIPDLIEDEKSPETVLDCSYDHAYDAITYGIISHHVKHSKDFAIKRDEIWSEKDKLAKRFSKRGKKTGGVFT